MDFNQENVSLNSAVHNQERFQIKSVIMAHIWYVKNDARWLGNDASLLIFDFEEKEIITIINLLGVSYLHIKDL